MTLLSQRACIRRLAALTWFGAILAAHPAQAAEQKLNGAQIVAVLSDAVVVGAEEGATTEQIFQKSGLTLYTENGAQSQGNWKVEGDQYCSVWPPSEYWACYDVLQDGDLVIFVPKSGKRYPTRLKSP